MVFPGARSTGCKRCRKRRIKCDERKPSCARCETYGALCPGYYRPLELRFYSGPQVIDWSESDARDDTPTASSMLADDDVENVLGPSQLPERSLQSSLQRCIQPLGDSESLAYFLHEFCIPPTPGIFIGFLNYLPDLMAASEPDSALKTSLLASATLFMSRHSKSTDLYLQSRQHYGTALRALSTVLQSPEAAWKEDTITTILFLKLFEDIHGNTCQQEPHLIGIVRLLFARNQNLIEVTLQRPVYGWAFTQLQIHAFITGQSFECLKVPLCKLDTRNITPGMGIMTAKVSEFCRGVSNSLQSTKEGLLQPEQLLKSFQTHLHQSMLLQRQVKDWYNDLSPLWKPKITTVLDGQVLVTSTTRLLGMIWPLYYSVMIFFYIGVQSCCEAILGLNMPDFNTQGTEAGLILNASMMARDNILQSLGMICNSIQYNLGEVDERGKNRAVPVYKASSSYYLIWPLALVVQCRHSTDAQSQMCSEVLQRIRLMYGIGLIDTAMSVIEKKCYLLKQGSVTR